MRRHATSVKKVYANNVACYFGTQCDRYTTRQNISERKAEIASSSWAFAASRVTRSYTDCDATDIGTHADCFTTIAEQTSAECLTPDSPEDFDHPPWKSTLYQSKRLRLVEQNVITIRF